MEQTTAPEHGKEKGWGWIIGLFAFLALYVFLGLFDRSTEITPTHDHVLNACFVVAGLCGLLAAGLALGIWHAVSWWKRAYIAVLFALVGCLATFLLSSRIATLVENATDFPAGRTQTKRGLLVISRAYRTHGKGQSWNIQTTPIWSNLDLTREDYDFMLAHPPPDGVEPSGDEIHSHGYLCANVSVQISGPGCSYMLSTCGMTTSRREHG